MTEAMHKRVPVKETSQSWGARLDLTRIPANVWIIGVLLLFVPTFTSEFTQHQIFGWAFILGMISLSLMIRYLIIVPDLQLQKRQQNSNRQKIDRSDL